MKKLFFLFSLFFILTLFIWYRGEVGPSNSESVVTSEKRRERDEDTDHHLNKRVIETTDIPSGEAIKEKQKEIEVKRNFTGERDEGKYWESGEDLFFAVKDNLAVAFGDVVLGELDEGDQNLKFAKSHPEEIKLWEERPIFYKIDEKLPHPERVREAISHIQEKTGLIFVEPHEVVKHGILFTIGKSQDDCLSFLGQQREWQSIWVGKNCTKQSVMHEILHALGLFHEQSRTDRNSYVRVVWENIIEEKKLNFATIPERFMDVVKGFSFDYRSIMLYDVKAFSKNGRSTLIPLRRKKVAPTTDGLSEMDIEKIKKLYDL